MDTLSEYIIKWNSIDGIKPCNEDIFVDEFIKLISNYNDERDITFDGDGAYFGKQVTLHLNSGIWVGDPEIFFEIAYSGSKISVYSAKNDGFWWPEYLKMESNHPRFDEVKKPLFELLHRVFGLD